METKEVMAKIRWALEEATKGNVDALDQIYDPNIVFHLYPFPDIKGLQAVKQGMLAAWKGFSDVRIDWGEMIGEGNTIAIRHTVRSKHTGVNPQYPVPATGKEVIFKGCYFAHQRNGKCFEIFEYDDWLGFLQQLGVVPLIGSK